MPTIRFTVARVKDANIWQVLLMFHLFTKAKFDLKLQYWGYRKPLWGWFEIVWLRIWVPKLVVKAVLWRFMFFCSWSAWKLETCSDFKGYGVFVRGGMNCDLSGSCHNLGTFRIKRRHKTTSYLPPVCSERHSQQHRSLHVKPYTALFSIPSCCVHNYSSLASCATSKQAISTASLVLTMITVIYCQIPITIRGILAFAHAYFIHCIRRLSEWRTKIWRSGITQVKQSNKRSHCQEAATGYYP